MLVGFIGKLRLAFTLHYKQHLEISGKGKNVVDFTRFKGWLNQEKSILVQVIEGFNIPVPVSREAV